MQSQLSKLSIGSIRSSSQRFSLDLSKNAQLNQLRIQSGSPQRSFVTLKYRPEPTNHPSQEVKEPAQTYRPKYVHVDEDKLIGPNKRLFTMPADPYVASSRINQILETYSLREAEEFVGRLPLRLQSTAIWNQLIAECGLKKKANMGMSLFTKMRKRGFKPNERTFTLLITCFSESSSPIAGERAKQILETMKIYNFKPNVIHMNALMKVYSNFGQPKELFQTLENMKDNNIQPDNVSYTIAMKNCHLLPDGEAVRTVQRLWKEIEDRTEFTSDQYVKDEPKVQSQEESNRPVSSLSLKAAKVANDRSYRVDKMRLSQTQPIARFTPDDSLIAVFLLALSRNAMDSSDLWFGIRAIEKLYGLRPSQVTRMMEDQNMDTKTQPHYHLNVTSKSLFGIMRFCGGLGQYKLGEAYCLLALKEFPDLHFDAECGYVYEWLQKEARKKVANDSKRWKTQKDPKDKYTRKV
ncbi:hypothetical protein CLU79DRAFT_767682 [Phycomyces nitens]|nr:hypothetical protein CLU79DRAFT_767682 [Phycomyces nitens]